MPAAYVKKGTDVVGKPPGSARPMVEAYEKNDYHQPSDEFQESWDFSGAVEDMRLAFWLGCRVADAPEMPRWNKGDEFEAARLKALDEAKKGGREVKKDPRVDAYIAKAAPFARPILKKLRAAVHAACPEAEETIKWSMPVLARRAGRILCGMAAFKAHADLRLLAQGAMTGGARRVRREGGRGDGPVRRGSRPRTICRPRRP